MVSRYAPVKQEGICLLPPPGPHYRMMPPQRSDGFHGTPSYVQQQQGNQTGNQGPGLRSIANTGPPNQSSTPPNTDLKVPPVPQPTSLNHIFVPPAPVRGAQASFYRPAVSTTPTPATRMPNRQGQQIYQQTAPQLMHVPMQSPALYLATPNPMSYFSNGPGGQRPQQFMPQVPVYSPNFPYAYAQAQPQPSSYQYYPMGIPSRPGPPSQSNTAPQNAAQQTMPNMSMTQPTQPQPPYSQKRGRRPNALAIIDPDTGMDRLNEVLDQDKSHPPSGESSARGTPQPPHNPVKEVQAAFAKQVAQAINSDDNVHEDEHHSIVPTDHIDQAMYNTSQAVHNPSRLDPLVVQSSTLKAHAKEFVLNAPSTAKEPPIVSANCDAIEVTLPNKQPKDRESPAKMRKQSVREHKDSIKESSSAISKDTVVTEKVVSKEDRPKEQQPVVPQSNKEKDSNLGSHQREEKKTNKKDSKVVDTKVPLIDTNENATVSVVAPVQPAQEVGVNAKSRNASRTKDVPKQSSSQTSQKQQPQPIVPPPQPARANNKTSRKSELNQKGASKEGTDMDVFNDNSVNFDTVNANIVNNSISNDIINANAVTNNNNINANNNTPTPAPVVNETTTTTGSTKKLDSSDQSQTIKPEIKPLTRNNYDITSIVKENPNPVKPFSLPVPVAPQEAQDDPDRPPMNGERLRAKSDANEAPSGTCSTNSAPKELYILVDGKIRYTPEMLLKLKQSPLSNVKHDGILDAIIPAADDRSGRMNDARYAMGGGRDFTPPFVYGGKSGSQRGTLPKRNSQSGKPGGQGGKGSKSSQNQMPKLTISLREDVKLHEAENAWKPHRLLPSDVSLTEDDKKTEELYRKVRGVLNKLAPNKYKDLVVQVHNLQIDTAARLKGVMELVFDKAIDEPKFSEAYAYMCKELALIEVPVAPDKKEGVNFRKLLVTRCQQEFEKNSVDESIRKTKIDEITKCDDAEKKKVLSEELDEYDRNLRMRSVGNIRFIGELFKKGMLTAKIMFRCLNNLLDSGDEESLECLCKLLSTVGKELESDKNLDLNPVFNTMKEIAEKKHQGKVSSRIRFMLQDCIDLRRNKWVPRRQDNSPKTIEQIQKEHESEQLNIQVMNSMPAPPRKDDRGGPGSSGGVSGNDRKQRRNMTDDGWTTTRSSRANQFTVISDKLKTKPPQIDEPLGSSQMFGSWGRGSNIKTQPNSQPTTANMYSALENIDTDKRPMGSKGGRDVYSSKGTSMERTFKPSYDGRGSRSGSQQRNNDSKPSSHRSTPGPMPMQISKPIQPVQPILAPPSVAAPDPKKKLTEEQLERHITNNLDEFVSDSLSVEEYDADIKATVDESYFSKLVADGYFHVLDKSSPARLKTGKLFAQLIKRGTLSLDAYCTGLEDVLSQTEDLAIDIPKIWDYMPEILVHALCEEALPLTRLHKAFGELVQQNHAGKILVPLFTVVISEKGPNFLRDIWQASGLTLQDFMPASEIDNFIKQSGLGFLVGGKTPVGVTQLSNEQIHNKLSEFLSTRVSFDDIVNWITANVGDRVKENKFIRVLATAIFEDSIAKSKLNVEVLQKHYNLLHRYVDNNPTYELQCLYALQTLINRLEHPKGLLLSICSQLYEDSAFSQESFLAWETCTDQAEQEGKGVALKQLVSFFTQLKENDDDEYDGSSSEEA